MTGTVHVAIVVDTTGKVISAKAVDGATVSARIGGVGRETMAIQTCHDEWQASDWNWNRFGCVQPGPILNSRISELLAGSQQSPRSSDLPYAFKTTSEKSSRRTLVNPNSVRQTRLRAVRYPWVLSTIAAHMA